MMEPETPISRDRTRSAGIWAVLHLVVYYGAVGLIWGLALKRSLAWSGICGAMVGFILGAVFIFPVIAKQVSEDRTKEMMFAAGAIWGNLAIVIGFVGLVVWAVRAVFF